MIAVREDPLRGKTAPGALGAFPCPPDQHLGIGAAGQPHELAGVRSHQRAAQRLGQCDENGVVDGHFATQLVGTRISQRVG